MFMQTGKVILSALALTILLNSSAIAGKNKNKPSKWQVEWYLRLIVAVPEEGLLDKGNVLGQLNDSIDGPDSHDLIELAPFTAPYLTLIFPHPSWPEQGNYGSDFHDTNYDASDQWVFQVLSDDSSRDVILYWNPVMIVERNEAPQPGEKGWSHSPQLDNETSLINRMWLEDTDTGDIIRAVEVGEFQQYQFNMEGSTTRNFRWVLDDKKGKKPRKPRHTPKNEVNLPLAEDDSPPAVGRYR